MRERTGCITLSIFFLLVSHGRITAQTGSTFDVSANYTKTEVMIPMRDGVRLFTQIYVPKSNEEEWPILMERTPYGCQPYGPRLRTTLGPSRHFASRKYIFVYQDIRGRNRSEGEHIYMPPHIPKKKAGEVDESSDCWDTIEWLTKNVPNNCGRVGTYGVSQPGLYVTHSLLDAHPALVCASPQAPVTNRWVGDDDRHNGAFFLAQRFSFMWNFGQPRSGPSERDGAPLNYGTSDGYKFFLELGPMREAWTKVFEPQGNRYWKTVMDNPDYTDFWQKRDMRQWLKGIRPAVLVVGGLFDAEDCFGAWQTYAALAKMSPGCDSALVMGPWSHGGWGGTGMRLGQINFGSRTGTWYEENIELPFFEHHLKHAKRPDYARVTVFETGGNRWRNFGEWPPKSAVRTDLWPDAEGMLRMVKPAKTSETSYVSDPADPVPYTEAPPTNMRSTYMIEDQRFLEGRKDVLNFLSEPMDTDFVIAGPIKADLWIKSTGTDADFIVKVIDEFPQDHDSQPGFQMLVRAEIFRAKYRENPAVPVPLVPDQPTRIKFDLQSILHRFKKGHKMRIQVQSSWFPLTDRNPQTFVDINSCGPEAFQTATHTLLFGGREATRIEVLRIQ